jgi:hypothetical protein
MLKIPMAAFATAIRESGLLQVTDQFTNLSRHARPLLKLNASLARNA